MGSLIHGRRLIYQYVLLCGIFGNTQGFRIHWKIWYKPSFKYAKISVK